MEEARLRSQSYLATPEGKRKTNIRKRRYIGVRRHLDNLLQEIIAEDDILPLCEVLDRIRETKGIRMRPSTIEKLLSRYKSQFGEAPLEKTNDAYRINHSYYELSNRP